MGPVWDCDGWRNKLLLLSRWNKLLIKKSTWYLVNYIVVVGVNLKNKIYVFNKFYCEKVILVCNDQNAYKFNAFYLYVNVYGKTKLSFC